MLFPLRDNNTSYSFPVATITIILINIVVYVMSGLDGFQQHAYNASTYGFIPTELFHGISVNTVTIDMLPDSSEKITLALGKFPSFLSIFTAMFMHGSFMHLFGNMWFLWLFGDNVEDRMGSLRYILFYLIAGFVAAMCHAVTDTNSAVPMIGASGAIAGVSGAYILLFPRSTIRTLAFFLVFFTTINIPAVLYLGVWFAWQVLSGISSLESDGEGIAFFAHVGGFITGLLLVHVFALKNRVHFKRINKYESYY